ncbi:hypothetical protein D3C73_1622680 [compost metagenome]
MMRVPFFFRWSTVKTALKGTTNAFVIHKSDDWKATITPNRATTQKAQMIILFLIQIISVNL